jgi:TonB family protein
VVTYWANEEYFRPSRHSRQSADVHYELILDDNGKIISLKELEVSNFRSDGFSIAAIDSVDSAKAITSVPVQPAAPVSQANVAPPEVDNDQRIYEIGNVDSSPEYPGGSRELLKFLGKGIHYPAAAQNSGTEGKVFVGFIIEKNGSVSGVNVLRGIGSGCDEEAMRVVRTLSGWKPAMVGGKPVRNAYVVSIAFKLRE